VRLLAAALVVVLAGGAVAEDPKPQRAKPQGPAAVRFADDVPALLDSEWGWRVGGFGGVRRGAPLRHLPVVFVHGNNVDAGDWYPVRDAFRAAGWSDQELWGLSYNGLGGSNGRALFTPNPEADEERRRMGKDGVTYVTENEVNVPDLARFLDLVRDYTGSERFLLVGHSLGVTLARETLRQRPDLREDLVALVGIAGANAGTSFCPPGTEGRVVSCDEIAAGTPWLARLDREVPAVPGRWLMVYDGSGVADPAFLGPYAQSPAMEGAVNRQYAGTYHNDLRLDPAIVAAYRAFLEQASAASLAERPLDQDLREGGAED
jgi:pimeloyl-ACP methyl ester carboxylesterase